MYGDMERNKAISETNFLNKMQLNSYPFEFTTQFKKTVQYYI